MVGDQPGNVTTPAPPDPPAPVTPAPPRRNRWPMVGAIALVVLLIIGYVVAGAISAAAASGKAHTALNATIKHQDTVSTVLSEDPFKGIDLKSANPDMTAIKAALAKFDVRMVQAQDLVKADQAALADVRPTLHGSALTLPFQGILSGDAKRVDAANSALATATRAISYNKQQSQFLHPFFDSIAGFVALGNLNQNADVATVISQVNATEASLHQAVALAKPPAVPTQIKPLLDGMQKVITDLKGLLAAAQAHDEAGVTKWTAAGDADSAALSNSDSAALDNADKALFAPLNDAYNRDMKTAAGG